MPGALGRPGHLAGIQINQGRRGRMTHGDQGLVRLAVGRGEHAGQFLVDKLDAVRVQRVFQREIGDCGQDDLVLRFVERIENGDRLLRFAGFAVDHDHPVVQEGFRQRREHFVALVAETMGERQYAAIRSQVEVVVHGAVIRPDDVGIGIELDHAVAPGRVGRGDVDRDQVTVGLHDRLAPVHQLIALSRTAIRCGVPQLSVGQAPTMDFVAVHADQMGRGAAAAGVQGIAGVSLCRVVDGGAAGVGTGLAPLVRLHVGVFDLALEYKCAARLVGVRERLGREDFGQHDGRPAEKGEEQASHEKNGKADAIRSVHVREPSSGFPRPSRPRSGL